jgi:signal transduction histidine kinase
VPAPSRRILLYWLLLLLPTLAVGAGALFLLRREQARLDEQERSVAALRRETIAVRARQIAENVELIMGDVQSGLMATLNQTPVENPDAFLNPWGTANPLVRSTFRLNASGRIIHPAEPERRRWIEQWIAAGAPWRTGLNEQKETDFDRQQRKDISDNVSKSQSLRSTVQLEANVGNAFNSSPMMKSAEAPVTLRPERSGWTPWRGPDGLHLIGWRQMSTGTVIGCEANLASVVNRFGELLPRDGDLADAFEVREAGVTKQSKLYRASDEVIGNAGEGGADRITIPLSLNVLPGWEVVGYVRAASLSGGAARSVFLIGSLVIGTFIVAILAGGGLLLRDARRSEAEAAQKTSFVANVSHEFKTPLTTIRLYAELLEQGRVRDEQQGDEYLRTIGRETQRLARLVNNVLDFSRLEQGRKKYKSESFDLTAELSRLLESQEPRLAEAGLTLRREFPGGALVVNTDRDALEQIVLNLLDNACKYAADGGEVTIAVVTGSVGAAGTEVHVLDRGPGVPLEHRERIFEKFHRVDETLTAEKSGAGLGLSIARQLARGMGGDLRYVAREGGGAQFILTLS